MADYAYSALQVLVGAITRPMEDQIKTAATKAGDEAGSTVSDHISKGLAKLGPAAKAVGKATVAGLGLATTAAVAFGVKAYKAAEDANKIAGQTAAVIKSTGGVANVTAKQIDRLSASIMAKTGIDDDAIKSGTNMMLTFTNVRNEAGKGNDVFNQATSVLTDMTAAMTGGNVTGEAMKKQAIQLGKALNDPIKGISALSRVGVTFTQQQKDQITAMVQSGHTMAAQKLILHELNREFGGTAAATATMSQRIKTAYGEVEKSVGKVLLKALNPAATAVGKLASKFSESIAPGGKLAPIFNAIGGAVGRLAAPFAHFVNMATVWLDKLKPAQVQKIADAIKHWGPALAGAGGAAALFMGSGLVQQIPIFGGLLSHLLGPLKLFSGAIGSIGKAAAVQLFPALKGVVGEVGGLGKALGVAAGPVGIILTIFTTLMAVSPQFRNAVMGLVKTLIVALMPAFKAIIAAIKPLLPIVNMLARLLGNALAPIIKALTPILVSLMPLVVLLAKVLGLVLGLVVRLITPIIKMAVAFEKWYIIKILVPLIGWLVKGLTFLVNVITSVVKWIMGGSPGLIPAFKALEAIVVRVVNIVRNVVVAGFNAIRQAISACWRVVSNVTVSTWHAVQSFVGNAVRGVLSVVSNVMGTLRGVFSRAWNAAVSVVQGIGGRLVSAGADAVHSLLSGISGALAGIGSWVKAHIVDPIVNAVKNFFHISSPSQVMAGLGKNVGLGFISGLVSSNPLGIAKHIFGGIPGALAAMLGKGLVAVAKLPAAALRALGNLGGWAKGILGKIGGFFGGLFGGGGSPGVQHWAGLVSSVLAMLGLPPAYLGPWLSQMATESGGNPSVVNRWDSNWLAGHPSQGLLQVIPGTFAAYAGPFARRGILDPLANVYAAINYALHRYGRLGMLGVIGHGHGYASGGIIGEPVAGFGLTSGSLYTFGERGPELVTPLGGQVGRAHGVTVNVYPRAHQSETEIAAAVSRQLAWAEATGAA